MGVLGCRWGAREGSEAAKSSFVKGIASRGWIVSCSMVAGRAKEEEDRKVVKAACSVSEAAADWLVGGLAKVGWTRGYLRCRTAWWATVSLLVRLGGRVGGRRE